MRYRGRQILTKGQPVHRLKDSMSREGHWHFYGF